MPRSRSTRASPTSTRACARGSNSPPRRTRADARRGRADDRRPPLRAGDRRPLLRVRAARSRGGRRRRRPPRRRVHHLRRRRPRPQPGRAAHPPRRRGLRGDGASLDRGDRQVAIHHRLGRLAIGDTTALVAASTARRAEAFAARRRPEPEAVRPSSTSVMRAHHRGVEDHLEAAELVGLDQEAGEVGHVLEQRDGADRRALVVDPLEPAAEGDVDHADLLKVIDQLLEIPVGRLAAAVGEVLGDQVHRQEAVDGLVGRGEGEVGLDHRLHAAEDRAAGGRHHEAEEGAEALLQRRLLEDRPRLRAHLDEDVVLGRDVLEEADQVDHRLGDRAVRVVGRVERAVRALTELERGPRRVGAAGLGLEVQGLVVELDLELLLRAVREDELVGVDDRLAGGLFVSRVVRMCHGRRVRTSTGSHRLAARDQPAGSESQPSPDHAERSPKWPARSSRARADFGRVCKQQNHTRISDGCAIPVLVVASRRSPRLGLWTWVESIFVVSVGAERDRSSASPRRSLWSPAAAMTTRAPASARAPPGCRRAAP
ncbi:MAG: molybdenum cofactor biosynthesis protein MoaE [Myxococcales bacterium]|nr:molybdenum cofactor biosynthesis protein MoaE [Myxococcales bacterium]